MILLFIFWTLIGIGQQQQRYLEHAAQQRDDRQVLDARRIRHRLVGRVDAERGDAQGEEAVQQLRSIGVVGSEGGCKSHETNKKC